LAPTRRLARPGRLHRPPARLPFAAAVLALLLGCAPQREDDLYGINLEVQTQQPWASDPAFRQRLHDLLKASCEHAGIDPTMLWGMTLRIEDGGISCGPIEDARGCTWREAGVVAVSTLAWTTSEPPVPCVEDTPIPHELLHVKIGDPGHTDPRWSDPVYWRSLSSQLPRTGCSGDPPYLIW
jgi:hypothetical protein